MGARIQWQHCGMFAAALLLAAPDALACSRSLKPMSRAQIESYARARYAEASTVVDAEVELPMGFGPSEGGVIPAAVLRVIGHYKGARSPGDERIALIYFSSCDVELTRKGERVRILLTGGPELYRADQTANVLVSTREAGQGEFNAEIDRLVGTPRPVGFSTYPGAVELPSGTATAAIENSASGGAPSPAKPVPRTSANFSVYLAGAFALLLAFFAGFLIGRGRRGKAAAAPAAG
ncbi:MULTISPECIES: hypothetical protein [unclassified Sphingomonas]|nr:MULTISPECIES: hypothetical protein [unclassified Sphingomonas]MBN8813226.1 hypothetical protein [Sphingomonas sp.]OJY53450.1 MAG: hypothetical protein BGP17_10040 [Sphingomonas sp. 67-41]